MTICPVCNKDTRVVDGCVPDLIMCNNELYPKVRFGEEGFDLDPDMRCFDCSCAVMSYHHTGCSVERCPCCRGPLINCKCSRTEETK